MKPRFAKDGVKGLKRPAQSADLNLTEHLGMNWNADLPDFTNALVAEWIQIPISIVQDIVASFSNSAEIDSKI